MHERQRSVERKEENEDLSDGEQLRPGPDVAHYE
jgi:hypothetical protein